MLFANKRKVMGIILICFMFITVISTPFQEFASLPQEMRLFEGKSSPFPLSLPGFGTVVSNNPDIVNVTASSSAESKGNHSLEALGAGSAELQVKLGSVALKKVKVDVLPDLKVYPGGQSIGVRLNAAGPLIVGHHFIKQDEEKISPGQEAGIYIGDMITKINGTKIESMDELDGIVNDAGKKEQALEVELLRGKETVQTTLDPAYDEQNGKYRLGLYIRQTAAGVGTLTFVDPQSGAYGALGHVISDVDTQKPIVVGDGEIVDSDVSSIEKGTRGVPGEKFSKLNENNILGKVDKNTPFGIFGHMEKEVENGVLDEPIPVGLSEEVEQGPAEILTVIEGQEVEKFDIEVVDIVEQDYPAAKGLVIEVTDERLLDKTGGIVQGMSGSPIIQNGKLIGAVTHVFVNDPTSGYGSFIEWMLQDAEVPLQQEDTVQNEAA